MTDSQFAHPSRGFSTLLKNRGFLSMVAAQALGVFNDNSYKTLLSLYILSHATSRDERAWLLPASGALFVIPYILFSSFAGQVADRLSKRRVIVLMKTIEIALMGLGTLAMFYGHIPVMLAVLFLMGTHSTFLSPAKEGIILELVGEEDLSRANGLLQLTIYTMIVFGPVAAGLLLSVFPDRPYIPVSLLVGVSLVGFALSQGITRVAPSGYAQKFRWNALKEFVGNFSFIRSDRALMLTVLGIAYFWFLGASYLLNVLVYGRDLLNLGDREISFLNASISVGIGLGAALAGKLSGDQVELGLVPIGSVGLGVFGIGLYFASHSLVLALVGHFLLGLCGGVYIVPLDSFLQQRAGEQARGRVIGASNVLTFLGVFVGSGILWLLSGPLKLRPDQILLVLGVASFGATAYILTILPDFAVRLVFFLLTHSIYRVRIHGLEHLPKRGGALLVCNHVSFIDPFLVGSVTQRFIRFLMWRSFYEKPGIHWFAKLMGAIPISDEDPPRKIVESLREAQARLAQGELVCIFAEGAITRTGNLLRFQRGLERIVQGTDAPIIPVHLDRLWGSIFSFERGRFFTKWPQRFSYALTVSIGAPIAAGATAFGARQAVMRLGAEAFSRRDTTQKTLVEMFITAAKRNWWRFSMADSFGRKLTFLKALAGAMLFRRLILRKCPGEEMVGILLPPMVPSALLNVGISMTGRVPVNLNYTASEEALDSAIARCQLKTIITSQKLLDRFSIAKRPGMVMIEDLAKEIPSAGKIVYAAAAFLLPGFVLRRWLVPRAAKLDSLATIIFSSGSTGLPKGVMLSHRNIVSNIEGSQQAISINRDDCLLGILPFFHSFGFTVGLWLPLISGCSIAYHANPLEARTVGELCRNHRVTILVSTPTFAWKYVQVCTREDFSSLRLAVVGAEKMKLQLAQAFEEKFGVTMFEGYGCTELSPVVAVGAPNYVAPDQTQPGHKLGSVGHPIPGVAARVVDADTLQDLGCGKEGMLLIKSPGVMQGYLGEPEKTRQVITPDGWYVTGDIARLDEDGFITITDRLSRFSKIAGEMVPHVRIEEALHAALGSAEPRMVVTSVPDEQKGEKIIVLHTELGMEVEELLKRLREAELPRLWIPKCENFYRIDALPVLGTGKLDLKRVKDTAKNFAVRRAISSTS